MPARVSFLQKTFRANLVARLRGNHGGVQKQARVGGAFRQRAGDVFLCRCEVARRPLRPREAVVSKNIRALLEFLSRQLEGQLRLRPLPQGSARLSAR